MCSLRVGEIFGQVRIRGHADYGAGLLGAGGVRVPLGPVTLTPGLSFRWMVTGDDTVALGADVGIQFRLTNGRG